jgi:hypothetical protein
MNLSRWTGCSSRHDSEPGRSPRGRDARGLEPACEALDGRRLLSTVAAAPAVLPTPPASAVANAAAELKAIDPMAFAPFQKELSLAETHSHVTAAEVGRLAQDEAAIDQAIGAAGLDATTASADIDQVRDVIDHAFLDTTVRAEGWARDRQALQQDLAGVPGPTPLVDRTIAQMHVVARAATPTGAMPGVIYDGSHTRKVTIPADLAPGVLERTLPMVWRNLEDAAEASPAADQHPLEVFYDGQVNNFIKD